MNLESIKNIIFDLFEKYDELYQVMDALRSLESEKEISENDYNYLVENFDNLLNEWLENKEKERN